MLKIDYDSELFRDGQIMTYSGNYFDAFNPDPELIKVEDIAHALSQQPRFAGHLRSFYSVAQHSLYVARLLPKPLKLLGLLHDAAETYLCDIPSPYKARIPEYKQAESALLKVILLKFGQYEAYVEHKATLKAADTQALKIEWDVLMQGRECRDPLFCPYGKSPERIEAIFLRNYYKYGQQVF